jgi:hypothetical protein
MWIKWIGIIVFLIAVSLGIAAIYGSYRWQSDTDKLREKLTNGRRTIKPQIYDEKEIEGLPEPVQRFFRTVIKDGQAIASTVKLSQQGLFNLSEMEDKWSPFTATQLAIAHCTIAQSRCALGGDRRYLRPRYFDGWRNHCLPCISV